MDSYITNIWQIGAGTGIFRFQTTDPRIARKLNWTAGWQSIVLYCNKPIWIFQKTFNTLKDARKKLLSLTKIPILEKGSNSGEFYYITFANATFVN